jgi:hypothetical protein
MIEAGKETVPAREASVCLVVTTGFYLQEACVIRYVLFGCVGGLAVSLIAFIGAP